MSANLTLYLGRHAQSKHQEEHPEQICGRSEDTGITRRGYAQSWELGSAIRRAGIRFDLVLLSSATRNQLTGCVCLRAMNYKGPVITDPRLSEVSQGEWEGKPRKTCHTPEVIEWFARDRDARAPKGESINMVEDRGMAVLNDQVERAEKAGRHLTILALSHGFTDTIILGHILDWPIDRIRNTNIPNASLSKLPYENGYWGVDYYGGVPDEIPRLEQASTASKPNTLWTPDLVAA